MREYQPSNKVPFSGFLLMCLAVVVGGIVIGGVAFFISYQFHFFLILIFPAAMGLAGAWVMEKSVKIGKIRNKKIAVIFGILAGIMIIGVWRIADYEIGFRSNVVEAARLQYGVNVTNEEIESAVNRVIETRTGQQGVIGYTIYSARQPQAINFFNAGGYIPVNEFLMWIIWIIEWATILILCILGAGMQVDDPFNEQTQRWYGKWVSFASVSWDRQSQFIDLLKRGEFQNAGRLVTKEELFAPCAEIQITGDENDSSDWLLRVREVELKGKNVKREQRLIGFISPNELDLLRDAMPESAEE